MVDANAGAGVIGEDAVGAEERTGSYFAFTSLANIPSLKSYAQ